MNEQFTPLNNDATFKDVKHMVADAISLPPRSRKGVPSQIVNLAAWTELWKIYKNNGKVSNKDKNRVRAKYNVCTLSNEYLNPVLDSDTPPTIGQVKKMLAERKARICELKMKKKSADSG